MDSISDYTAPPVAWPHPYVLRPVEEAAAKPEAAKPEATRSDTYVSIFAPRYSPSPEIELADLGLLDKMLPSRPLTESSSEYSCDEFCSEEVEELIEELEEDDFFDNCVDEGEADEARLEAELVLNQFHRELEEALDEHRELCDEVKETEAELAQAESHVESAITKIRSGDSTSNIDSLIATLKATVDIDSVSANPATLAADQDFKALVSNLEMVASNDKRTASPKKTAPSLLAQSSTTVEPKLGTALNQNA